METTLCRRAPDSPITSDSELERLEFQFYKLKWLILGRKYTNYLPKSAIFLWPYTFREYTCSESIYSRRQVLHEDLHPDSDEDDPAEDFGLLADT